MLGRTTLSALAAALGAGALALTAAGCAAGPNAGAPAPQRDGRSIAELEAAYRARVEADRARFVEADVHFMTGMIGHHAQALIMAAMAPTHGAGPEVSVLAARIDNAQRGEISWMQQWLRDRGQDVPEVHIEGTRLMIHGASGHHDHTAMPGMLSDAQLAELDAARGAEFDRLFLRYMIQHHGGAVVMVDELFASDGAAQHPDTFKLASDVQVDQRTEIARMQLMLDGLAE
jgi:uncharacterized protein (DUF305 family)